MTAPSKSPEAAQRKVWRAELKAHETSRRKVVRDFDNEEKRLIKAVNEAGRKHRAFLDRRVKQQPRILRRIDERIATLRGRLGL